MPLTRSLIEIAPQYFAMRESHPGVPASVIYAYLRSDDGVTFAEFCCPGHKFAYTGSAYGGDDERWCGEGRCYCVHCGADGDA